MEHEESALHVTFKAFAVVTILTVSCRDKAPCGLLIKAKEY